MWRAPILWNLFVFINFYLLFLSLSMCFVCRFWILVIASFRNIFFFSKYLNRVCVCARFFFSSIFSISQFTKCCCSSNNIKSTKSSLNSNLWQLGVFQHTRLVVWSENRSARAIEQHTICNATHTFGSFMLRSVHRVFAHNGWLTLKITGKSI